MYLIYQVTSHDYLIEEPWKFMGGSSSRYVSTLTSLVITGMEIVEICLDLSRDLT